MKCPKLKKIRISKKTGHDMCTAFEKPMIYVPTTLDLEIYCLNIQHLKCSFLDNKNEFLEKGGDINNVNEEMAESKI